MSAIYLDNHASTPVDPRIISALGEYLTSDLGNPQSSENLHGEHLNRSVEEAKTAVLRLLNARRADAWFCSGATEAIQLAITGFVRANSSKTRIALPRTEHRATLDTVDCLRALGLCDVEYLQVDSLGRIDLDALEQTIRKGCDLVVVMMANNEIGTIHPISEIAAMTRGAGVTLLCDTTQAAGKEEIAFTDWGVDIGIVSAHKMYGTKGVGALVVDKAVRLKPAFGASLKSGTPNTAGIFSLGLACQLRRQEMTQDEQRIRSLRNWLQERLSSSLPIVVNGDLKSRLAGNLHFSIPEVENSAVIARIRDRVSISTGSACAGGEENASHVLRAIGMSDALVDGSFRIGVGKFNTLEEIGTAADIFIEEALSVMRMMSLPPVRSA